MTPSPTARVRTHLLATLRVVAHGRSHALSPLVVMVFQPLLNLGAAWLGAQAAAGAPERWALPGGLLLPTLWLTEARLPATTLPIRRLDADRAELFAMALPAWFVAAVAAPWLPHEVTGVALLAPLTWVAPHLGGCTALAVVPTLAGAAALVWFDDAVRVFMVTVATMLLLSVWVARQSDAPEPPPTTTSTELPWASPFARATTVRRTADIVRELVRRLPERLALAVLLGGLVSVMTWLLPWGDDDEATPLMAVLMFVPLVTVAGSTFAGARFGVTRTIVHLPVPARLVLVDLALRTALLVVIAIGILASGARELAMVFPSVMVINQLVSDLTTHADALPSAAGLRVSTRLGVLAAGAPILYLSITMLCVGTDTGLLLPLAALAAFLVAATVLAVLRPVWRVTPP